MNLLETVTSYKDTWNVTFYYVATLALLIGLFWAYMRVFVKPLKKSTKKLEENIIYNHSEDVIEDDYKKTKKKK